MTLRSRSRVRTSVAALVAALLAVAGPVVPAGPATAAPPPAYDPVLVSSDAAGEGSAQPSRGATVSDDGRLVAFESNATDLFAAPPGFVTPAVLLKDLVTGELRWINRPPAGEVPAQAFAPVVSGDGSIVVFGATTDESSELVPGVTGPALYRHDVAAGTTSLVARLRFGMGEDSLAPSVSADGSIVAFWSANTDLDPALPPTLEPLDRQLFVWEASTGTTRWINRPIDGTPITGFDHAEPFAVAPDGSAVVYTSASPDLVAADDDLDADVFSVALATGATSIVSDGLSQGDPVGPVTLAGRDAISSDAGKVLLRFAGDVATVVPGVADGDGLPDVVSVDRFGPGGVSWVSGFPEPGACTGAVRGAAMDATAAHIVFAADCGDGTTDLYRFDAFTGPVLASRQPDGTPWRGMDSGEDPADPDLTMSADGRVVVFEGEGFGVAGSKGSVDVVALVEREVAAGDVRASLATSGSQLEGGATEPAVSDDGRVVAFLSTSGPPGSPPLASGHRAAYVKDRVTGVLTKVPDGVLDGVSDNPFDHSSVDISGDGRTVVVGAATGLFDKAVFAWDRVTGATSLVFADGSELVPAGIEELSVSDDGRRVAFVVNTHPVGTGDTTGIVSEHDGTAWQQIDTFGTRQSGVSISGDGSTVVWTDRVPQVAGMEPNPRFDDPTGLAAREVYARDVAGARNSLVSATTGPGGLATAATSATGNSTDGTRHAVSDDGSDVAFVAGTSLSELGLGTVVDRNGNVGEDVLVADLDAGTLRVASLYGPSFGTGPDPETCPGPLSGARPTISDDGRTTTFSAHCVPSFSSFAEVRGVVRQVGTGFVEQVAVGDAPGRFDVFSPPPSGVAAAGDASVVAVEVADALVAADTNGAPDVYVGEPGAPPPAEDDPRASLTELGSEVAGDSIDPSISDDGAIVAFRSTALDLVAGGPTDGAAHLYVKDRSTGAIRWVDRFDCFGCAADGSSGPEVVAHDLSGDGRIVVYATREDSASGPVVALHRESTFDGGVEEGLWSETGGGADVEMSVSDDGTEILVAVSGTTPGGVAAAPVDGATGRAGAGVYLWEDAAAGDGWSPISTTAAGSAPDGESRHPSISGDGTVVTFVTTATDLAGSGSTGGRALVSGVRQELVVEGAPAGTGAATGPFSFVRLTDDVGIGNGGGEQHRVSDDGSVVAFTRRSFDGRPEIGVVRGGTTTVVSGFDNGEGIRIPCPGAGSTTPSVSDDGRVVAFSQSCSDRHGQDDAVPVRSVDGGEPEQLSADRDADPGATVLPTRDVALGGDGAVFAWDTPADLVATDTNGTRDVYVLTRAVPPPPDGVPAPVDDVATTFRDVPVEVDVLANDGGTFDPASLEVVAVDVGVAEVTATGRLRYTPPAGVTGTAAITYRLTGPGGSADATLRVTVDEVTASPMALSLRALAPANLGGTVPLELVAENTTGATLPSALVTVAAELPTTITAATGAATDPPEPAWRCEVAPGGRSATCAWPAAVAPGATLPPVGLTVDAPNGPPYPFCDAVAEEGDHCMVQTAWNGDLAARATAEPAPVEARTVVGAADLVGVSLTPPAAPVVGEVASWAVAAGTTSGGTGAAGAEFVRFRASDDGSTFVSGASADAGWSCTADPTDPRSGLCTYADWPAFPLTPGPLVLSFRTGAGLTSGCVGVAAPCTSVEAIWTDATFGAAGAVRVARGFASVQDPVAPDAPDAAVQLSHPSKVGGGLSTTFTANVINVGDDPTSGAVTLDVGLPVGITPTTAAGKGWACTVDGPARTARCTRSTPLPEGAAAGGVLVTAAVAADAPDGTATARVTATGDDNPGNDADADAVDVTPPAEQADGILGLALTGPALLAKGQTVRLTARATNNGSAPIDGPTSFTVALPDGLPAGQRVTAAAEGEGWTCATTALKGTVQLRCTTKDSIAAKSEAAPVVIALTAIDVVAGSVVDLPFTVTSRAQRSRLSTRFEVVDDARAVLGVDVEPGAALFAGSTVDVVVSVANRGKGPATGPTTVDLPVPAGLTVAATAGRGWTCTGTTTLRCRNAVPLREGMSTEILVVSLAAPGSAAPGSVTLRAAAAAPDRFGDVSGRGAAVLPVEAPGRGGLALGRDPEVASADETGAVRYPLVVGNVGTRALTGTLTVTEVLPAVASATASGPGWDCTSTRTAITCTRPLSTLAPGASAPPITVGVVFPAAARGTTPRVIGTVRSSAGGSGSSAATFLVPPPPPPAPALTVSPSLAPGVLTRGGTGAATATVRNTGTAPLPPGTLVGMVLPEGSTGVSVSVPVTGCRTAEGGRAVAVCALAEPLGPGASRPMTTRFAVAGNAPDEVRLHVGEVRLPLGTTGDRLAAAADLLVGQGPAALHQPRSVPAAVEGLVADAGDDQEVMDLTPRATGSSTPTEVALDGTASHGGAPPLTMTWVQTSGPAVTWSDPTGTRPGFPAGSPAVPFVTGAQPTFTPPRVRGDVPVVLTFQLTVLDGTGLTRTDDVTVSVTPAPNRAPTVGPIATGIEPGTIPDPGSTVTLSTEATDPEGDRVALRWAVTGGDGPVAQVDVAQDAKGGRATLRWPKGTSFLVVEVTADDGRSGTDAETVVIGSAPPPLQVTASGPSAPVAAGDPVEVVASAGDRDPDDLFWVWEQVSGPAVDALALFEAQGPELTVPAPAADGPGQSVVLRVTASGGTGAAAAADDALVTVRLADTPAPTIGIVGAPTAAPGAPVAFTAVTDAVAPATVVWSQAFGPGGSFDAVVGSATSFTLGADAVVGITATVTDAAGRRASATVPLVVGSPFVPDLGAAPDCADAETLLGRAFAAAAAGGALSGSIGPVSVDLGQIDVEGACGSAEPRLSFADASFSAGGILSGSGLTGSMTADRLCVTGGELDLPASWGVGAAAVAPDRPVCLEADGGLTGSVVVTGFPFLALPPGVAPPVTTIDLSDTTLSVVSDATIPTGGAVHAELTAALTGLDSPWSAELTATAVDVLGQPVDLSGSASGSGATLDDLRVAASVPGPVALLPGAELTDLEVEWTQAALSAEGSLSLGGQVDLDVAGRIVDAEHWELTVTGRVGAAPISPLPDLTIDPAGFVGTVRRDGPALSDIVFDVQLEVDGEWSPVPAFSLRQLTAQLSNAPAPTDCPAVDPGSVWFRLGGSAVVDVGTEPIEVNAAACVALGGGADVAWSVGATATFGSWTPVDGIPVSVESIGVTLAGVGLDVEISLHGGMRALGVDLGASVFIRPADLAIVVDGFGDLSAAGVGLAPGSTGHVTLASVDVPDFRFDDPLLAGVPGVRFGLGLFAGFAPDPGVNGFVQDVFGLPPITALVVSAELGGPDVTLRAGISLGAGGIPLFTTCPAGACTLDGPETTSLALTSLELSLSLSGRIGFAADARLHLPASPDGSTPASDLTLTAEIAIDLAGPAITLALFTSDGTWNGALGVAGLNLADLAIQGGVNFASPVPVPTVGFGATVVNLPSSWATAIGAPSDPADQEAMSFVLNISQTAPILAIHVGEEDGRTALRPLQAIPGQADSLLVDHAELVVAPFGGTVGPYTFQPGLSVGFAGVVGGVDVDVAARVTLIPPALDAEISVGPVTLAGVTITDVAAELHITTAGFAASFDGAVALPDGMPTMRAGVDTTIDASGIRAAFTGTVEDWDLASFGSLDTLTVAATADLATLGSLPQFTFAASGSGQVLGTPVAVSGSAAFDGGVLSSADLRLAVGAFRIGPAGPAGVTVTGKGCDGVTGGGDDGACLTVGFDRSLPQPFRGSLSGEVTVAGLKVSLSGTLDQTGVAVSGAIDAKAFGSVAFSGRIYSGDAAALAGLTEARPDGAVVAVETGDWVMRTTADRTGKLGGFDVTASVAAGTLDGVSFVFADGDLSFLGNQVSVTTNLSFSANTFRFHAEASTSIEIDDYDLASVDVVLDNSTGLDVDGDITIPEVGTVRLAGGISPATASLPVRYSLAVEADVAVLGVSAAVDALLANGDLDITVDLDAGGLDVRFTGEASATTRRFCVQGDTTLQLAGPNVAGWFKYCNKNPQRGVRIRGEVLGYTVGPVAITVPDFAISARFGPYEVAEEGCVGIGEARVCLGFAGDFDVEAAVSVDDGFSVDGSGSASAYAETWVLEDWEWKWKRFALASISLRVDEEEREACGTVSGLGQTLELCT